MTSPVQAFHFIGDDRKLRDGSDSAPVGGVETYNGKCVLCESGLHASRRPIDALSYAPGVFMRLVECSHVEDEQDDKLVCRSRKILWEADISAELHEFACQCAERALALVENPDPRSIAAIEAKRKWLRGEISDDKLRDARAAADAAVDAVDAAGGVARGVARAAARAAWAVAWDAARAAGAAWAAWAAAWGAGAAAGPAAWAAAWSAAGSAAWAAQNEILLEILRQKGCPL